jgi:hypothetical protein
MYARDRHHQGWALMLLVAAALLAALSGSAKAAASRPLTAQGPVTFTHTPTAAGTAAGITTVLVDNDANGQITFQVNFARPLAKTDGAAVFIDADQNPATGSQTLGGAEYILSDDESTNTWDLEQWNGSDWTQASAHATVKVTGGQGTSQLTFSVNRAEIGVTTAFNFWVGSIDGSGGSGHQDEAPDSGTWNYQLQAGSPAQAVHLAVLTTLAPATAKAGSTYTVGMLVQRSDTLGFLGAEGDIQCTATLRGKPLPALASSFVQLTYHGVKVSVPMCVWQIPRGARGSTLRGTITVSYQGAEVTRHFSARVK